MKGMRKTLASLFALGILGLVAWSFRGEFLSREAPSLEPSEESHAPMARTDLPEDDVRQEEAAAPRGLPSTAARLSPLSPLSGEEFEHLAKEVSTSLPTLSSLRESTPEQAHGIPPSMKEAGLSLGRIARALEENPDLHQAGLSFYEGCASREDLPKAIRALCYSDLKSLALKSITGGEDDLSNDSTNDSADYPADVRDLARKLEGE